MATYMDDQAEHRRAVIEDVLWLTDCGEHPENVLRRLSDVGNVYGSVDSLIRSLERWGEPSLARRLRPNAVAA